MTDKKLHEILKVKHHELLKQRHDHLRENTPFSLEIAGYVDGVRVINDSAATNPLMVAESLASFSKPVVWIAEANSYTGDLTPLASLISEKVKVLIVNGPRVEVVHRMLYPGIHLFLSASSWEEALDLAIIAADANDTVLLSPCCRADEPFKNYKERGAYFKRLVDIKSQTKTLIP